MSVIRIQVFLVDTGAMYHVEASLNRPVSCLKESISRTTRIPVDQQVLLLSGGVPLFAQAQLCHYESVSDNTVFLVCKSGVPDIARPVAISHRYSEEELLAQLDASIKMPPVLDTVKSRMLLVQTTCEIDKRELQEIRQLVFDQHLQQQGWAAVVANLEEVCSGFRTRVLAFQKQFGEYTKVREDYMALLRRMPDVLTLLGKIPVLVCLEDMAARISLSLRGTVDRETPAPLSSSTLTLYNWMNSQDSKHRLEDVIYDVTTGTKQMSEHLEEAVSQEVHQVWQWVEGRPEMRCIGGIEERLYSLDKLTNNVKGIVDLQISTREGFRSNWSRLELEQDRSILPDLCASHRTQMLELRERHKKLVDLKKKCVTAKKELCTSIQSRLPWLMQIHQAISTVDSNLLLHHDLLRRIHRRAEFLQQVEQSPQVYALMVVEVVRRRLFSDYYIKWATGVAEESKKEHKKEMRRRRAFSKQYGSHFLKRLFVGFKDHVPKFATEPLKDVDHDLPGVTPADISHLSKCVPELQHLLRIPTDTGSPSLGPYSSSQHPHPPGDRDLEEGVVGDPFLMDTTTPTSQSLASSTASFITRSLTSVTQSLSEAPSPPGGPPLMLLLGGEREEREKLSLSYQAGGWGGREAPRGGEGGAENKDRDASLFLSLQEKMPVPQCLSETLTAEVNSAAMSTISVSVLSASPQSHEFISTVEEQLGQPQAQPQPPQPQHPEGGGDGVLLSSGDLEPAKSSDSDVVSHESQSEHKPRKKRRSVKGLSDTSPEGETSQEFTTADFYFEDSMPSSIADSPPKASGSGSGSGSEKAAKPSSESSYAELAEKAKRVDELEGEVSVLQSKLAGSQEKIASLRSVMNGDLTCLRESLGELRSCVQDGDGRRRQDLAEAQQAVGRLCVSVGESQRREEEEAVRREREGSRQSLQELEAKFQAKCLAVEELQQGMLKVSHCIADVNKELQQQRETNQRQAESTREKHEEEVRELRKQNLLELELETDRVRTELQLGADRQEAHVQSLQQDLEQARQDVAEALKEKETASQTLLLEFEDEKKQLQESLQAEKTHALEQVRTAVMAESRIETESLLQRESQQKASEAQQQLEDLQSLQEKQLEELREELQARHRAELDSLHKDGASQLAAREASLRGELDTEIARLQSELEKAVGAAAPPEAREVETQSEELSVCHQGVQNQVCSVSVDVQSERCETGDHSVQWDMCWGVEQQSSQTDPPPPLPPAPSLTHQSSQTDPPPPLPAAPSLTHQAVQSNLQPEVRDHHTETDGSSPVDGKTQTEDRPVCEQGVQSEGVSVCDQGIQGEAAVLESQGVQSNSCAVTELGVQSDSCAVEGVQSDSCGVSNQSVVSDARSVSHRSVQCDEDFMSLSQRHSWLSEASALESSSQVAQLYEQLLAEQTERMQRKMGELREQLHREKEEAMLSCKRSILADRQISFNEAIARAVKDRDAMIDDLRAQLNAVTARGGEEECPDIRRQLVDIKEKESDLKHENRRLESEVTMLQQQLHQYSEQVQSLSASTASIYFETAAATPMTQSCMEGAVSRLPAIEQELQARDQKIKELEKKLMEMSMTGSLRKEAHDKVSILTDSQISVSLGRCQVGDIVLLCLDERHGQYVVFTLGNTLHFLHSDCIDSLGLRPVEGELRKNWVLAEVTDREYCQARKAQNRFKVEVNSKFYRVKAKPWSPKSSSSTS